MLPSDDLPRPVSTEQANTTVRGTLLRTFGSLDTRNYRLYFTGDLVSHVGSWMQTMAEAWLVSTLTGSGVAVGATFAFRFLPVLLFGLWGGTIADRFDRRRVLLVTQTLAAVLAVVMWLIVLTGVVQVWMVFALAIALGFVTVVDEPARHAFVEEMVGRDRLPNAVALTSAVGNSARITGPAAAGLLIATVGTSWVFFVNAVSFFAVVGALVAMRTAELHRPHRHTDRPRVREGLAYAWSITEIRATILLVAVVGTLVYNFPTFLTLLARDTFHGGAGLAGFLMAVLGVGTVVGALTAAARARPTSRTVVVAAALLGITLIVAAAAPGQVETEVALLPVGAMAVFFGSTANAHMQIWSAPQLPRPRDGDLHAAHARDHGRRWSIRRLGVRTLEPAHRPRLRRLRDRHRRDGARGSAHRAPSCAQPGRAIRGIDPGLQHLARDCAEDHGSDRDQIAIRGVGHDVRLALHPFDLGATETSVAAHRLDRRDPAGTRPARHRVRGDPELARRFGRREQLVAVAEPGARARRRGTDERLATEMALGFENEVESHCFDVDLFSGLDLLLGIRRPVDVDPDPALDLGSRPTPRPRRIATRSVGVVAAQTPSSSGRPSANSRHGVRTTQPAQMSLARIVSR